MEMDRPSALDSQSACYSSYKSKPTMKALIGITPSGVLAFVSDFFPGSTSEKEITQMTGLLNELEHGDEIMADKRLNIQDELASVGVSLVIPAFLKGKTRFSMQETTKNKAIASVRIHVERMIERLKSWYILDRKITISMAPFASDVCGCDKCFLKFFTTIESLKYAFITKQSNFSFFHGEVSLL